MYKKRDLQIYTWGIQKHQEPKCSISFDLTKFTSKTDKDIRNLDGRDEEIQISIINHPKYNELIDPFVFFEYVYSYNYKVVMIFLFSGRRGG